MQERDQSIMDPPQNNGHPRPTASCTECQRRKQKCSREWPCDHCRSRRVPHLCRYGSKKTSAASSPPERSDSDRSIKEPNRSPVATEPPAKNGDILKDLGYMSGQKHFNIGHVGDKLQSKVPHQVKDNEAREVEIALKVLPTRTLTDSLVQNFLSGYNYRYYSIYPASFLEQYSQWWADRAARRPISPYLTCLLIRICACSSQHITTDFKEKLEFELVEDAQTISQRFHDTAERLSGSIERAKGGIVRIQELFLAACWYKGEARFVEFWHVLCTAVREAQEMGLHDDSLIDGLSEFEMELRRRLWCLLYLFDWQISKWLVRPHAIEHRETAFRRPNLRLKDSNEHPELPSPFVMMALLYELMYELTESFGDFRISSSTEALRMHEQVGEWVTKLPATHRMVNPDTRWDLEKPYIVIQRLELQLYGHMLKMGPLKAYVTRKVKAETAQEKSLIKLGIDDCLVLMDSSRIMLEYEAPQDATFNVVTFCVFDTAMVMSSAIINDEDVDHSYKREEMFDAIHEGLDMLRILSTATKSGATAFRLLTQVMGILPSRQARVSDDRSQKRARKESTVVTELEVVSPDSSSTSSLSDQLYVVGKIRPLSGNADIMPLNMLGDPSTLDMGGMEQIWDWQTLNLEMTRGPPLRVPEGSWYP